jgi:hypothetical protein
MGIFFGYASLLRPWETDILGSRQILQRRQDRYIGFPGAGPGSFANRGDAPNIASSACMVGDTERIVIGRAGSAVDPLLGIRD